MKTTTSQNKKQKMAEANKRRSEAMKAKWAARAQRQDVPVIPPKDSPVASREMSLADVTSLIESCARNGVLSLQYGQLQLLFKKTIDEPTSVHTPGQDGQLVRTASQAGRAGRAERLQENLELQEEQLEHLKITDPEAYERFMQSGDADGGGTQ